MHLCCSRCQLESILLICGPRWRVPNIRDARDQSDCSICCRAVKPYMDQHDTAAASRCCISQTSLKHTISSVSEDQSVAHHLSVVDICCEYYCSMLAVAYISGLFAISSSDTFDIYKVLGESKHLPRLAIVTSLA